MAALRGSSAFRSCRWRRKKTEGWRDIFCLPGLPEAVPCLRLRRCRSGRIPAPGNRNGAGAGRQNRQETGVSMNNYENGPAEKKRSVALKLRKMRSRCKVVYAMSQQLPEGFISRSFCSGFMKQTGRSGCSGTGRWSSSGSSGCSGRAGRRPRFPLVFLPA